MKAHPVVVGIAVVLSVAIAAAVCWYLFDGVTSREFPAFPAVAPVTVLRLKGSDKEEPCVMEGAKNATRIVKGIADRYPTGWKSASRFVDYAPSYRIETGDTKILVLKGGLVIIFTSTSITRVVQHDFAPGDPDVLIHNVCTIRR